MSSSLKVLDLLGQPFGGGGLSRSNGEFAVSEPWALARFGKHTLKRGWWVFECEGEGDVGGVELRLLSPEDTLLTFSLRRFTNGRAMLPTDRTFDVSLMVSAWPGTTRLSKLRLRRMSKAEEARTTGAMLLRLLRSDRPFSKLVHVASRALSGRSLRIRTPAAAAITDRPQDRVQLSADFQVVAQGGVTAVLRVDEQLHARALEIAAEAFKRSPMLQAVYADAEEGGLIRPRPAWDADLASAGRFAGSPAFFRGPAEATDPWPRLQALAQQPGALARIALPLAIRAAASGLTHEPPAVPRLAHTPPVSIIIPTKSRLDLLELCLNALAERTNYSALDVVIVDNGADPQRMMAVLARASGRLSVQRVEDFGPFNFSRLINFGARHARGEILLLLNDDIEATETGWLHRIVESAMSPDVGCVGARLLYPDRSIQHAGVMLGLAGVCGHLWKGLAEEDAQTIPQVVLPSGRMAVTGACLAVRRDVFERAGGLDEENFPIAFNDIDFCLRVRALGFRTVYRGDAVLIHHESQSRGPDDATLERRRRLARETGAFLSRWGAMLSDDPFGSPAFDLTRESGAIHPSLRAPQASRE